VVDLDRQIDLISMNCLRNVFGRYSLQDCLANRSQIADETLALARQMSAHLGVQITNVQIKDISLPPQIRNMLASTATAEREGKKNEEGKKKSKPFFFFFLFYCRSCHGDYSRSASESCGADAKGR
jgi:regulator of protease activity HflC (stomatin/prohibitin superfamily)